MYRIFMYVLSIIVFFLKVLAKCDEILAHVREGSLERRINEHCVY